MARVAMITFLVMICTIIVEAVFFLEEPTTKSSHEKLKSEFPYYWEVICSCCYTFTINGPEYCDYIFLNHRTGKLYERSKPNVHIGPEDLKIPAPVPVTGDWNVGGCEDGWYNWQGGGTCYKVSAFNDTKTQCEAAKACKNIGAELLYSNFFPEWELPIAAMYANHSKIRTHYIWTSGYRDKDKDKWYWGNNHGEVPEIALRLSYIAIGKGHPDHGNCLATYILYDWQKQLDCNFKFNYVCKKKAQKEP
ncbi:uncharacterized protein LOC127739304 [Mytilus californianus]|uniref:uncharacterized protein LOC127739304 n=1 Tax=Mytilus californianus TaxID=6549 RepID=UPI002246F9B7|nr:uncharacterized protein LOC127739304 [Mytilus californianus]XP_052106938.1 uncharacterized protein LOC127739304 [Mytilus californianus]